MKRAWTIWQKKEAINNLNGKTVMVAGRKSKYTVVGMNHDYNALLIREGQEDNIDNRIKVHPNNLIEVI